jgi:Na+/H+-dicarboxylate symporter
MHCSLVSVGFLYVIIVQAGVMGGLIGHISPLRFLRTMKEAMAFVFATCSSVATIPINLKCTKNLGVDEDTANFIIPFGAVMNMNGTAIYEAVAVVFTAEIFGIHLSATDQLMVMVSATLAASGTAGIPGSRPGDADHRPQCSPSAHGSHRTSGRDRPDPEHGPGHPQHRRRCCFCGCHCQE